MTDRAPATEAALDLLHAALARRLQERLDSDDPLTAAEVTAVANFLRANNITALPTSSRLKPLAAGLAALSEDEPAATREGVVDLSRFRTSK